MSQNSLSIIESYLINRRQYVSIKGQASELKTVKMGVPQGSVLGPFFFIVAINDLPSNICARSVLYADDTTLFLSDSNLQNLTNSMQIAENNALDWFTSNKLLCNQDKTQRIILSLAHNVELHSVKLLGFEIDTKLNWSTHIEGLSRKLSRVSYLIWKLRDIVTIEYLRTAYFGLFYSHISYGILLWGHSPSVSEILILQKKVVRTICQVDPMEHCKPLFVKLKFLTVINLYIFQVLLHIKQHIHTIYTREDFHSYNTRGRTMLNVPQHRLAKMGNSYMINGIKFFNRLPAAAQLTSFNNFKNKIFDYLVKNPFYSTIEYMNVTISLEF